MIRLLFLLIAFVVTFALAPLRGAEEEDIAIPGVFGVKTTKPEATKTPSKTTTSNTPKDTPKTDKHNIKTTKPTRSTIRPAETWTDDAPIRSTPPAPTAKNKKPRKSQEIILMPKDSNLYSNDPEPTREESPGKVSAPAKQPVPTPQPTPRANAMQDASKPASRAYSPQPHQPVFPTTGALAEPIAEIDGYSITRHELYQALVDAHGRTIFERILNRHLLRSELEKQQLLITEEDIENALKSHVEKFRSSAGPNADLEQMLRSRYHMTLDEYKAQVVWVELALQRLVKQALQISEADLFNFYFPRRKNYARPEQVSVAHILISPLEFSTNRTKGASVAGPNEWRKAMMQALNIQDQLKKGADFSTLAKRYSHDKRTVEQGGVIGFFARGTMLKPFEDAAFALKNDGDYSDLVKTMLGYHIIKRNAYRLEEVPPFDKIKDKVRTDYTEYMMLAESKRLLRRIQQQAIADGRLRILDTGLQQKLYPQATKIASPASNPVQAHSGN